MSHRPSLISCPQQGTTWLGPVAPAVRQCIFERLPDIPGLAEVNRLVAELRIKAPHLEDLVDELGDAASAVAAESMQTGIEAGLYYGLHPDRLILGEAE